VDRAFRVSSISSAVPLPRLRLISDRKTRTNRAISPNRDFTIVHLKLELCPDDHSTIPGGFLTGLSLWLCAEEAGSSPTKITLRTSIQIKEISENQLRIGKHLLLLRLCHWTLIQYVFPSRCDCWFYKVTNVMTPLTLFSFPVYEYR